MHSIVILLRTQQHSIGAKWTKMFWFQLYSFAGVLFVKLLLFINLRSIYLNLFPFYSFGEFQTRPKLIGFYSLILLELKQEIAYCFPVCNRNCFSLCSSSSCIRRALCALELWTMWMHLLAALLLSIISYFSSLLFRSFSFLQQMVAC